MRVQLVAVIASIGIVFGSWHESDVRARYANGGLVTVAKTWASAFGVRAAARSSYSDTTPPVIVASVEPPADASGWHHADVHITWAVQNPESGIAWVGGGCQDQDVTADTSELALTCNASNGEGLIASSTVTVRLDKTLPVVALSMGTTLGEPIVGRRASISAHAVDNHAIARVEFFIDGAFSGSDDIGDGHGNYSATVDSTMFSDDAPPPIKAVAYDVAGNSSTAQSYLKIANRGLVAAYNFEEGNVTRVFDSAVHSSGVASNDGAFGKGVSRVPGVSGQALMFDGRTGFVTIPDSASLDVKHMTLMAWVKPTTITGWQTVVLKQATPKTSSGLAYQPVHQQWPGNRSCNLCSPERLVFGSRCQRRDAASSKCLAAPRSDVRRQRVAVVRERFQSCDHGSANRSDNLHDAAVHWRQQVMGRVLCGRRR